MTGRCPGTLATELWVGSLPVCSAERHEGKVRRLRLVLATHSHPLKAEVSSLQDGPYLPGRTAMVYGHALERRNGWSPQKDSSRDAGASLHNSTGSAEGAV